MHRTDGNRKARVSRALCAGLYASGGGAPLPYKPRQRKGVLTAKKNHNQKNLSKQAIFLAFQFTLYCEEKFRMSSLTEKMKQ